MSAFPKAIPPENFYGKPSAIQDKIEALVEKEKKAEKYEMPKFMSSLLGPSKTWMVFKKQQDAIETCLRRRNGLMCFVYEDVNGRRMFLVAHPKVFWAINSHRFFKACNTYELIQEHAACKLYLDIEFEYEYNKDSDGDKMLRNFLKIVNFNLNEHFNLHISNKNILNLDSSTNVKFSHHIIYEIENVAFQSNYTVGNFIKAVCSELKQAYENSLCQDDEKLLNVAQKYKLTQNEVIEFFILDNKNKRKLFIDEGVYTKNRHFRILGSSKQTKNIPLVVSKYNEFEPKEATESPECTLFLDSLVTYFSWKVNRVLDFEEQNNLRKTGHKLICKEKGEGSSLVSSDFYPQIDLFINSLISPDGRIRRKIYFSDSSTLVYDIQGFRYCDNIKRQHKSNNIKYVVDLQYLVFYQKCFDPDCLTFRSNSRPLPDNIKFLFEDDGLFVEESSSYSFSDLSDENFIKVLENIDNCCNFEDDEFDKELNMVMDYAEDMLTVSW